MSYTSVYEVFKTKANVLAELGNGHGSGPAIWDYIALKATGERLPMFNELEWFWPLWKDNRFSRDEKACLLCTYDLALVEVDYLEEFSRACGTIHKKIISETQWTWNHFGDIGKEAEKLHKKHDHRCIGLGLGCTSVSDPWEFGFDYDKVFGVYSAIESLKEKAHG